MLTLQNVFFAFVWIALLILAGRIIKQKVRWIQRLFLPESIVAGALALLRMVDPENCSGAFENFAYKQLFFEPIVGGGLFTAAAPALIASLGLVTTLLITDGLLLFWLGAGFVLIKQRSRTTLAS